MLREVVEKLGLTCEPVLFIYMFIYTTNINTLPLQFMHKLRMDGLLQQNTWEREASVWMFRYGMVTTSLSFLSVVTAGPISDIFGHKLTMLSVPVFGGIQQVIALYLSLDIARHSLWWLVASATFIGIFGDLQGCIGMCSSVLSTVTTEDIRTARIAALEVCIFIATAVAGTSIGTLLQEYGFTSVYALNLFLYFVMFLYIVFIVPNKIEHKRSIDDEEEDEKELLYYNIQKSALDTIPLKRKKETFFEKLSNVFKHAVCMWREMDQRNHKYLVSIFALYVPSAMGFASESNIAALYLTDAPFNLHPQEVGFFILTHGIFRAVGVSLLLLLVLNFSHQISDYWLLTMGLLSQALIYLAIGLSRSFTAVIIVNALGIMSPLPVSALRSMATKLVPARHHCTVIGLVMAVDVASFMLVSVAVVPLYAFTLQYYSGIPFILVAILVFIALVAFQFIDRYFI